MSGLRRSRPEEQDAALNKLLSIKQSLTSYSETEPELTCLSPSGYQNDDEQDVFLVTDLVDVASETSPTLKGNMDQGTLSSPLKNSNYLDQSKVHDVLSLSTVQHTDKASYSPTLSPKPLPRSKLSTPPAVEQMPPHETKHFIMPPSLLTSQQRSKSKSATSSPNLSHKKYLSAPAIVRPNLQQGFTRRGSDPLLHTRHHFQVKQPGVTEEKWMKLRSILVSMQENPLDIGDIMESSSPEFLVSLKEKISAQEQLIKLKNELSTMRDKLWQMENELNIAESERDAALALFHQMQSATHTSDSENPNMPQDITMNYWEKGIESLKSSDITKEEVLGVMEHLFKDFKSQRSYLDHLMMVVVTRAPWMLDEMDKLDGYSYVHDESSCYNSSDEDLVC